MEKILISACLVGDKTRYDGRTNYNPKVQELLENYELIPFCPEVESGLSIPRDPSERIGDKVMSNKGRDVTYQYSKGAELALNICQYLGIRIAILKEKSPACGVHEIHNGKFDGCTIKGKGVTTELLERKGIKVISEDEIDTLLNK